ncbi:type II secretion system F family protein [Virgibacillus byunsanensis]|uniref:Type II secretion system F family protein n=1 Tax=Virgibacillus byunsanensis TaxID=570945 RepID=A0ABW3LG25_9BACI
MLYVTYLLTLFLLVFGIVAWRKEKKQRIKRRIASTFQTDVEVKTSKPTDEIKKRSFSSRIISPIWKQLKQIFKRNLSSEKRDKIDIKLLRAGNPFGMTPVEFRIIQLAMFVLLPLIFGLYGFLLQLSFGVIVFFCMFGLFIATFLPSFYLKQKTQARNKLALRELPDFLDLLTVSIEAGLGFDSALSKVVSKKDGVLSMEFQRCLEEMRLGKTRREALTGVRERVTIDDVKSLIGSIIQAEQLGIGMVQVLNVQSLEIRESRKQRAEEQAMKAPIKMLFPLVLFIFPCIFIVILGPVVIDLIETLL